MQPWFPQFVRLVKQGTIPLLIPPHQHQLPGTNSQHPICNQLSLAAAIFSGTSQQRDYQLTSPRSSEHHGGSAHCQHTINTPTRRWLHFCNKRQLDPHQPIVTQLLDFLHTLYKFGLTYSAIGTHRSVISAIVEIPGVSQLGEHWLVFQFMKGIFHLRPPQPVYTKTWDVNKVLSYLKSLGPN